MMVIFSFVPVDISSVDRRNIEIEHKTTSRVNRLVDNYRDSTIFTNMKRDVELKTEKSHKNERIMKPRKTLSPPNAIRVIGALMK